MSSPSALTGALSRPHREEDRHNFIEGRERLPNLTTNLRLLSSADTFLPTDYYTTDYSRYPQQTNYNFSNDTTPTGHQHSLVSTVSDYLQPDFMPPVVMQTTLSEGEKKEAVKEYFKVVNPGTGPGAGVIRGKGKYQPLVGQNVSGLTRDGKEWLTMALDPFHDTPLHPSGFPDQRSAPSIVFIHREQQTIRAPTSVGTSNWDVNIFTSPFDAMSTGNLFSAKAIDGLSVVIGNQAITGMKTKNIGFLNWHSGVADTANPPSNAGLGFTPDNTASSGSRQIGCFYAPTGALDLSASPSTAQGAWRMIGLAFEVTNTTAPLYTSGAVTCYRTGWAKEPISVTSIVNIPTATPYTFYQSSIFNAAFGVPENYNVASALPNSQTWSAGEGCYVVAGMEGNELPYQGLVPSNPAIMVQPSSAVEANNNFVLWTTDGYPSQPGGSYIGGNINNMTILANNFGVSGAYFTGLSPQTTLCITVKSIYEMVPNPYTGNVDLVTPSAVYDPEALKLYSKIVDNLPPGVPVSWNSSGHWYDGILDVVRRHAHLFKPVAQVVKMAAPTLAPAIVAAEMAVDALSRPKSGGKKKKLVTKKRVTVSARSRGK